MGKNFQAHSGYSRNSYLFFSKTGHVEYYLYVHQLLIDWFCTITQNNLIGGNNINGHPLN